MNATGESASGKAGARADGAQRARRARMARRALELLQKEERALGSVTTSGIKTLMGAIRHAVCLEEVDLLLRYQQARDPEKWTARLVQGLWDCFRECAEGCTTDEEKVAAVRDQLGYIAWAQRVAESRSGRGGEASR